MKNPRLFAAALTSLSALGVLLAAAWVGPNRLAAETPKPDTTQVKALYAEKCSACHNLPKPEEKGYTRSEWQRTVNTMLTKYHASESIAPNEAAQIVDYLATFSPKTATGRNGRPRDPWATDAVDVWTDTPSAARVFNFEAGGLTGLMPTGAGTPGPAPVWTVARDAPGANSIVRAAGPNFRPDRFALLLDRADGGRSVDVRVRFRIDAGKASPAVGIVCGYRDPNTYTVLRCNRALGDLALIQISGATHTTVQQTPIVLVPPASPLAPGWHTLRLLMRDGQARGWIDMQKRVSVPLPNYTGGKVGLWTQGSTSTSFADWTVDWYDAPLAAPIS